MDIKAKIEEIVAKVKADPNFAESFKSDPAKAIKSIIGVDVPDDVVDKIKDGATGLLAADQAGGILGKIKNLF